MYLRARLTSHSSRSIAVMIAFACGEWRASMDVNGETGIERLDPLDPDNFRDEIRVPGKRAARQYRGDPV